MEIRDRNAAHRLPRVLQVMAGAKYGGAETAFADMCIALKEAGVDIAAATRADNPERIASLQRAGIPVTTLRFGGPLDLITPWRLARLIDDFRPDVVQTWMSRAASMLPRRRRRPYVVLSRLGGYYKLKSYGAADYFSTITPDIREHLVRQGVPAERVRWINNFAETGPDMPAADRSALGTPLGVPLIVTLARLHRAKALDVLIDAMVLVPGAHLWIAGEGPDRAALAEQIARLGLGDRVRLLGWRDDRTALLKAADIGVMASRYEPFGTTFVQIWAHRLPLVVADASGPAQYVRNGEDALLVPKDDAAAMAAAIRSLLDDKERARRIAEAGFRRYREEFSKERVVAAYIDYYRELALTLPASP